MNRPIEEQIQIKIEEIEYIIKQHLPEETGYQKTVIEAMNYSILAGGKRLRPMLMQETYTLFGGKSKVVEPFMAAIEMIHTYSLVHDDLPAMDNDEYRRGRKTTHVVYGEAIGILAGDGLLNYAFETASKAFELEPENINIGKALGILAKKAGIYGMIGGQTVDIQFDGQALEHRLECKEKLNFMYRLKTGALLESAMLIGAVLAGATKNEQKIVEQAAADLGLAFQIQDDILDITSTKEVLGKSIGSDEKNGKITYVTIEGLEKAQEEVAAISKKAVDKMNTLVVKSEFLIQLMRWLIHRKK
ncbi:polyprenyl synthetase family protein [Lachnospiraceae bacterium ZAX-1]